MWKCVCVCGGGGGVKLLWTADGSSGGTGRLGRNQPHILVLNGTQLHAASAIMVLNRSQLHTGCSDESYTSAALTQITGREGRETWRLHPNYEVWVLEKHFQMESISLNPDHTNTHVTWPLSITGWPASHVEAAWDPLVGVTSLQPSCNVLSDCFSLNFSSTQINYLREKTSVNRRSRVDQGYSKMCWTHYIKMLI